VSPRAHDDSAGSRTGERRTVGRRCAVGDAVPGCAETISERVSHVYKPFPRCIPIFTRSYATIYVGSPDYVRGSAGRAGE
jgi:hypothetical protein